MYPNNFFIPYQIGYQMPMNMLTRSAVRPMMGMSQIGRPGLFGRLASGMHSIKGINWGGLLNNASKTLGVVNQAIPIVKQAGPMFNNMRSMLKLASAFKDETDTTNRNIDNTNNTDTKITNDNKKELVTTNTTDSLAPNFFI